MIVWYLPFHGLHFATTVRVLTPVLCFHMTSFNYGAKGVRDVEPTCRCHQSNIMPDSNFNVNIAQCVPVVRFVVVVLFFLFFVFFLVCVTVCVCLGVIFWATVIRRDKVPSFLTFTLVSLGKP